MASMSQGPLGCPSLLPAPLLSFSIGALLSPSQLLYKVASSTEGMAFMGVGGYPYRVFAAVASVVLRRLN